MDQPSFTFLNTTGRSNLSQPAVKEMRAHVTKANFAKRRRRLGAETPGAGPGYVKSSTRNQEKVQLGRRANVSQSFAPDTRLVEWRPSLSAANFQILSRIQDLCFIEGPRAPYSPSEAEWFQLIASEPALVEATMACSTALMSPDEVWQITSGNHISNAMNFIQDRIRSSATRTDGVLAAACTMAFSAALSGDETAWKIHIEGASHIIRDRQDRLSDIALPPWVTDLTIQDSVNYICGFPRLYHKKIADVLDGGASTHFRTLAALCEDVIQLQKVVESHRKYNFNSSFVAREIEEPVTAMIFRARALRDDSDPNLDSAARAIELFLCLISPSQSSAHLALLAEQLQASIKKWPLKGCMFMDLTSFQHVIGAIAAEKDSSTRAWFVESILRVVCTMKQRGWVDPLNAMKKRNYYESDASDKFKALWKELDNMCVTKRLYDPPRLTGQKLNKWVLN